MRIIRLTLAGLLVLVCAACEPEGDRKFGYLLGGPKETEPYLLDTVTERPVPLLLDEEASDPEALQSFRALKKGILYGNADGEGIYLFGERDPETGRLALHHWYIVTPFIEWRSAPGSRSRAHSRTQLTPDDFAVEPYWDVRAHQKTKQEEDAPSWHRPESWEDMDIRGDRDAPGSPWWRRGGPF